MILLTILVNNNQNSIRFFSLNSLSSYSCNNLKLKLKDMDAFVVLTSYEYSSEANLAKTFLESKGVDVMLRDELTVQVAPGYSPAVGGVKLMVREGDYIKALQSLKNSGYEPEILQIEEVEMLDKVQKSDESICPFCKSANINRSVSGDGVTRYVYKMMGFFFPVMRGPYHCEDCNKRWRYI